MGSGGSFSSIFVAKLLHFKAAVQYCFPLFFHHSLIQPRGMCTSMWLCSDIDGPVPGASLSYYCVERKPSLSSCCRLGSLYITTNIYTELWRVDLTYLLLSGKEMYLTLQFFVRMTVLISLICYSSHCLVAVLFWYWHKVDPWNHWYDISCSIIVCPLNNLSPCWTWDVVLGKWPIVTF